MKHDSETKAVLSEKEHLVAMTNGTGWGIARARLVETVTELQNAFNIKAQSPTEMLIDLEARKLASSILFDWLKDIESSKETLDENVGPLDKPYIFKL